MPLRVPNSITYTAPTRQTFTSTGTTSGRMFTVTSANATAGATYTNNGQTFTVLSTISASLILYTSGAGTPQASGTLTKATGTGDATITFSIAAPLATYTTPANVLYLITRLIGPGGAGAGSGNAAGNGQPGAVDRTSFVSSVVYSAITGNGGGIGDVSGNGGLGGTTIGPGISITGVKSQSLSPQTIENAYGPNGGGSGFYGSGGVGVGGTNGGGAGSAATANQGCGGGGGGGGAAVRVSGGGGGGGYLESTIIQPDPIYYYNVGIGGTGGIAGTGGGAGGNGGSGIIYVTEYYQ